MWNVILIIWNNEMINDNINEIIIWNNVIIILILIILILIMIMCVCNNNININNNNNV